MKFKIFFFAFILIAISNQTKAQYYFYDGNYYESDLFYEVGFSAGAISALTDIGGRKGLGKRGFKDFNIKTTNISGGAFFGIMYKNMVGFRLEAPFGTVRSGDSILVK